MPTEMRMAVTALMAPITSDEMSSSSATLYFTCSGYHELVAAVSHNQIFKKCLF
jgi:hypothetical protein